MSKGWVISIGAGLWQTEAIKYLRDEGYSVLAVDGDKNAQGFKLSNAVLNIDIVREKEVLAAIQDFFHEIAQPMAVVCNACEAGMLTAAILREEYALPGLKLRVTKKLVNKSEQREAWKNLRSPKFFTQTHNLVNLRKIDALKSQKVVIKPVDSSGSRGVAILDKEYLHSNHLSNALLYSRSKKIILEEYIQGTEFNVESICLFGKTHPLLITKKYKIAGGNGSVANALLTHDLKNEEIAELSELLTAAHTSLGYLNGVCHSEVIQDHMGRFWLVETAGRGAGYGVSQSFVKIVTGYDYFKSSINFDLGLPPVPPIDIYKPPLYYALRFLESREGIFKEIISNSSFPITCFVNAGTKLSKPTTDGDRIGSFIVSAKTTEELDSVINTVLNDLQVVVH